MPINFEFKQRSYSTTEVCAALSAAWIYAMLESKSSKPADRRDMLMEFAKGDAVRLQRAYERACLLTTDKSPSSLRQAYTPLTPKHVPCDPKVHTQLGSDAMNDLVDYAKRNGTHGMFLTFSYMPAMSLLGEQTHTLGIWCSSKDSFVFDADFGEVGGLPIRSLLTKILRLPKYGGKEKMGGCHYLHLRAKR